MDCKNAGRASLPFFFVRAVLFLSFCLIASCSSGAPTDSTDAGSGGGWDGDLDGDTILDADVDGDSDFDSGADVYESDCPGNSPDDCTTEIHECSGSCAVNCVEISGHGWQYGETDCTHLGQCLPGSPGVLATCTGGGWGEYCGLEYEADCIENVSISCNLFTNATVLVECGPNQCWADGPIGGCRRPEDPECNEGAFSPCPCCEGYVCQYESGSCRVPEGGECTSSDECQHSEDNPLKCRDDGTGTLRCSTPTCIEAGDFSIEDGEYCGGIFSSLPCCVSEMECVELEDEMGHSMGEFCCFPPGATPIVEGSLVPSLCCNGSDMFDECN